VHGRYLLIYLLSSSSPVIGQHTVAQCECLSVSQLENASRLVGQEAYVSVPDILSARQSVMQTSTPVPVT
jgi:hypothetical protein